MGDDSVGQFEPVLMFQVQVRSNITNLKRFYRANERTFFLFSWRGLSEEPVFTTAGRNWFSYN